MRLKGKKAFILGAGGVVPSIIVALNRMGASKIILSNRTQEKAFNLKNHIVNCVINKVNEPIPEIDVITEAGILFELEKYFYDIPFHNIPEFFKDTGSPALIKDPSDFDSIFVVMPMKG